MLLKAEIEWNCGCSFKTRRSAHHMQHIYSDAKVIYIQSTYYMVIRVSDLCFCETYIAVSTSLFQVPQLRKIHHLPVASAIRLYLSWFVSRSIETIIDIMYQLNNTPHSTKGIQGKAVSFRHIEFLRIEIKT